MKRLIIYILAVVLPAGSLMSQSVLDIYRFSASPYLGSSRYMAVGGAMVSLGNDFTAAHQNPAGLGVFRRSEMNLTMGTINSGSTLLYQGSELNDDKRSFLFANAGLAIKFKQENDWQWSFGMSFNRMADYNNRMTSLAENVPNSRIDMWIDQSNGTHPDDLLYNGLSHEYLAYQSYLTDADIDNQYSSQAGRSSVDQFYTIDTKGGLNELAFILAAERDNKLFFGGSLNVPFVSYTSDVVYMESGFTGDSISSFTMKEHNEISGAGFNMKIGAIYKFDNGLRVGASIHSPTWYALEQSWEDEMLSEFVHSGPNSEVVSVYSDPYNWNMSSPLRVLAGISLVVGKYGFLSFDYEMNAFNTVRTSADSVDIGYLKSEVNEFAQMAHIFRFGGELRLNKVYLRGGFRTETSGLTKVLETDPVNMISVGAGYRGRDVTFEFAYAIRNVSSDFYFFNPEYALPARADISQKPLTFTIAYRFRVK